MNTLQIQKLYNELTNIKLFYEKFGDAFENYKKNCNLFEQLLEELNANLSYSKGVLKDNSDFLYTKNEKQKLDARLNSVKLNFLHPKDVENLKKILLPYVSNNTPTLELFPGNGQFLPYVVACEPLYIADRYLEICDFAAKSLKNEFYASRRLRKYEIKNFDVTNLPLQSFGLIYCFNEFFYVNDISLKKWLNSVNDLLYDGGIFIFNFMPDDQLWSQDANLKLKFSVIDYKTLINDFEKFNFSIIDYKIQPFRSSYFVIKKKGDSNLRYKINGSWAEIIDL